MIRIRRHPLNAVWLSLVMMLFLHASNQHVVKAARTFVIPYNSDEHQCTDNPLLLAQAINHKGEQTSRYNLGLAQRIDGTEAEKKAIVEVLNRMDDYVINEVLAHPEYASVRPRW